MDERTLALIVLVNGRDARTDGHDTQTPDVNLGTVLLTRHYLRSHPVWRADHGGTLRVRLGDLRAETEVGCCCVCRV